MVGFTFEGPAYADRVGGKLTFRDWDHWTEEDKNEWRDDPRVYNAFQRAKTQDEINERFSREIQSGDRVIVGLKEDK